MAETKVSGRIKLFPENFSARVASWKNQNGIPFYAILHLDQDDGGKKVLILSRAQCGVLHLLTVLPEINRDQIYEFMHKIGELTEGEIKSQTNRSSVYRVLRLLKENGLIHESETNFYMTSRGKMIWLAVERELKKGVGFRPFGAF